MTRAYILRSCFTQPRATHPTRHELSHRKHVVLQKVPVQHIPTNLPGMLYRVPYRYTNRSTHPFGSCPHVERLSSYLDYRKVKSKLYCFLGHARDLPPPPIESVKEQQLRWCGGYTPPSALLPQGEAVSESRSQGVVAITA